MKIYQEITDLVKIGLKYQVQDVKICVRFVAVGTQIKHTEIFLQYWMFVCC
jgi:hypothetical protein